MEQLIPKILSFENLNLAGPWQILSGSFFGVTSEGAPLVCSPLSGPTPVVARTLVTLRNDELSKATGSRVLLIYEDDDVSNPIIIGFIHDRLTEERATVAVPVEEDSRELLVDGRRIVLKADEELLLSCGKSSVSLSKDGKVIIRGVHLISRASQTNKIKGGAVSIN